MYEQHTHTSNIHKNSAFISCYPYNCGVMASGFALRRNGSCLAEQVDCGPTADTYHACCPSGSSCPRQFNVNCCPTSDNCTQTLVAKPGCANPTWDLYDNNGFFCCAQGKMGYKTPSNTDGCADLDYKLQRGEALLRIVKPGSGESSSAAKHQVK